ncbi:MAG: NAD-dependent epimerase/dehydratase family protein [Pseudomonadota bacterium]
MHIFMTGATGYIGGSVAAALIRQGHKVTGLVRSEERAAEARTLGIEPVPGSLDDPNVLTAGAQGADAVIHTADAEHGASADALTAALAGTGRRLLHTSGSSIVGRPDGGGKSDDVFDEATEFTPSPARASRVAIGERVLESAADGVHAVVVCPSLIYGLGRGATRHSMQVPMMIDLARKDGTAKFIGAGENIWSNVHIDDLVDLYLLALEKAPAGAFYFVENGENAMRETSDAINRMLGIGTPAESMSEDYAASQWGEGPARNSMGSNSRVRAVRAREELGWAPHRPSLIEEIETGCYASAYP